MEKIRRRYLRRRPVKQHLIKRICELAGLHINPRREAPAQFDKQQLMELESYLRTAHSLTDKYTTIEKDGGVRHGKEIGTTTKTAGRRG
jgi:hypothetical protein